MYAINLNFHSLLKNLENFFEGNPCIEKSIDFKDVNGVLSLIKTKAKEVKIYQLNKEVKSLKSVSGEVLIKITEPSTSTSINDDITHHLNYFLIKSKDKRFLR